MAGGERQQEGTQTAVDDLHAGPALWAVLAGLLKSPDGLDRTVNHHQRRHQEPKHLQTDYHHRAPAFLWKTVEAVELRLPDLPEAIDGRRDRHQHQQPDPHADPQGCFGGTQLFGFERVTDSHPSVHSYTHDGVDAAIYPDKIQAFQHWTERMEGGMPEVIAGVHFEGKGEEEEQVHQSQAGHVNSWLRPFSQNDAEHKQRYNIENQTKDEYGDVDDQLQIFHQVVHPLKWTVACHGVVVAAGKIVYRFDLISPALWQFQIKVCEMNLSFLSLCFVPTQKDM